MPRAMKRYDEAKRHADMMRKEAYAKKKAESMQFVADRKRAKALLDERGDELMHFAYIHWAGEDEPTFPKVRKWLKSEAWVSPEAVIKLFEKMEGRG